MLWHIITVNKMVKIGLQPYIHRPLDSTCQNLKQKKTKKKTKKGITVHRPLDSTCQNLKQKKQKKKKKKKESQSITGISFIENIGLCVS